MEEQHDKILVTTMRKVLLVQKLTDFMALTGKLMSSKKNPQLLLDKEFQEKTAKFLSNNSDMYKQKFWQQLSPSKQLAATKIMTFQEVETKEPKKIRIAPNRKAAELYIVLSGSATVKNGTQAEEQTYGPGQIFGNTEYFEHAFQHAEDNTNALAGEAEDFFDTQMEPTRLSTNPADYNDGIITAQLNRGSFMRMSLHDFYKFVLKPDDEAALLEQQHKQDSLIAGIPFGELTEDDFFYIKVYKRAKTILNEHLFSFMASYNMIPKNSRTAAMKYYNEGNIGRENYLLSTDSIFVFVVIEGSIRLEISTSRSSSKEKEKAHTVMYKRKGKAPMVLETKSMPILSLQSGSVLCLQNECYVVGKAEAEAIKQKELIDYDTVTLFDSPANHKDEFADITSSPLGLHNSLFKKAAISTRKTGLSSAKPTSQSSGSAAQRKKSGVFGNNVVPPMSRQSSGMSSRRPSDASYGSSGSSDSKSKSKSKTYVPRPKLNKNQTATDLDDDSSHNLYNIKMVFEQPTTYLAIPIGMFDKILDDDRLILPKISNEIKAQLRHANDSIHERITNLLPWILGAQSFHHTEVKALPSLSERPDFVIEELHVDNSTPMAMGSFLRQPAVHPTSDNHSSVHNHNHMLMSKSLTSLPSVSGANGERPFNLPGGVHYVSDFNPAANNALRHSISIGNSFSAQSSSHNNTSNVMQGLINSGIINSNSSGVANYVSTSKVSSLRNSFSSVNGAAGNNIATILQNFNNSTNNPNNTNNNIANNVPAAPAIATATILHNTPQNTIRKSHTSQVFLTGSDNNNSSADFNNSSVLQQLKSQNSSIRNNNNNYSSNVNGINSSHQQYNRNGSPSQFSHAALMPSKLNNTAQNSHYSSQDSVHSQGSNGSSKLKHNIVFSDSLATGSMIQSSVISGNSATSGIESKNKLHDLRHIHEKTDNAYALAKLLGNKATPLIRNTIHNPAPVLATGILTNSLHSDGMGLHSPSKAKSLKFSFSEMPTFEE